jgi:hypothetical protein
MSIGLEKYIWRFFMKLSTALELRTKYDGIDGVIRVDEHDYICLTEMASFFPGKHIDDWLRGKGVKEFISIAEQSAQIPQNCGIKTRRGNGGGTWAHHLIAFDFAMWLSPEFKIKVYQEYIDGTQNKKNWNIKRIMAAFNYKMLTKAIHDAHEEPKSYHYSNEALLINEIVFGVRQGNVRDTATEQQLDIVARMEAHNATLIELGYTYQDRKEALKKLFNKSVNNLISV